MSAKSKAKKKAKAKAAKRSPAPPAKPADAAPVRADPKAQQQAYDLGMKHYADESYAEAQVAWKEAIRLGPNTPLADQARENIKKTDQILKTLEEMGK